MRTGEIHVGQPREPGDRRVDRAARIFAPDPGLADGGDASRVSEAETPRREFDDGVVGPNAFGLDVDDAGWFIVRHGRQVQAGLVDPPQDPVVAARVEPPGHALFADGQWVCEPGT